MADMRSPIIGVTCTESRTNRNERPPRLGQNRTYLRALTQAGATPLLIPHLANETHLRTLYDLLDGLLLPGGEDMDPVCYGELPHEKLGKTSPERDTVEIALVRWAMEEGLPVLAICRGIQVLNVALGGSLYQDIEEQVPGAQKHNWHPGYARNHLPHTVDVSPQTRLARILGTTTLPVNSRHHQALKKVAPGLAVAARSPDGIIEAVEGEDHPFAIAVQWHPEDLITDERAQRLFDALVDACRA
jgi:putative glutamine amidotransferase